MMLFVCNIQRKIVPRKTEYNKQRLIVKTFHNLCFCALIPPIAREVEFNRGTVHYVQHNIFTFAYLFRSSKLYGISFFDIPHRLIPTVLVLLGVTYVAENMISGILWACIVYLFTTVLSLKDDVELQELLKHKMTAGL